MSAQFKNTSSKQFAVLTIAGIVASGIMTFQTASPAVSLFKDSLGSVAAETARSLPSPKNGLVAGDSNSTDNPANLITTLSSQVANLVNRVSNIEDQAGQSAVLGGSSEENIDLPAREEFPPAVNLLRNSSFEEDSSKAPRQWQYQYDSTSGNSFTSAEAIRTGVQGLKFVGGGTGNFGLSQPTAKTIERRAYALSLWVKPVNTDAHTVKLSFWDEVNNKEATSKTFNFSGTKEWSRIVFQVDNRNNWNGKKWFPMISVSGLGSGALYIDDVQLEEANSYTLYHMVGGGATQAHVSVLGDGSVEVDVHGNIYPAVNGVGDLGTSSNKFEELNLSKASIDKDGSLALSGSLTVEGASTLKGAINLSGAIKGSLIPEADDTYDLGSLSYEWRDLYVDGVGYIDGISLLNNETITNSTNGVVVFTDSTTSDTLSIDMTSSTTLGLTSNGGLFLQAVSDAVDALSLTSTAGGIDIFASGASAGEDIDIAATGSSVNVSSTENAVDSITLRSSRGGIDLSTGSSAGNGNLTLRSAGTLTLDTSATNSNMVIDAGTGNLTINNGTTTITTESGDVTINVAATNADTEDFVLRVSENATASTANGRDIFMAAVDDMILFMDNFSLTATNGANYNVSGADMALEINGDNDYIIRAGDGAAESTANGNDVFLAAEDSMIFNTGDFTLNVSEDGVGILALNAARGGITLSSSSAGGNGNVTIKSAGTLQLDTSANNADILLRTGTGTVDVSSGTFLADAQNDSINAIRLLADRGGINISSGSASGNGNVTIKSAGTLTLDTSANNSNIMVRAGTGRIDLSGNTIVIDSGAGTLSLSSNTTIKIASTGTASIWGGSDTLIGRPGTVTRVDGRLCIEGSGDGSACPAGDDGRLFVNTTGEVVDDPGDVYDVAEYYPASEAVDAGTVVVADSGAKATVKKSSYPYQQVLGVVSSTPAVMIDEGWFGIGSSSPSVRNEMKPLVALVGRVPVKVTDENGTIRVGDRLVASSKAGYAMKAVKQGMTLGMAVEDIEFEDASEGKVMTFVNVSWYFPEIVAALEQEQAIARALGTTPDAEQVLAAATQTTIADSTTAETANVLEVADAETPVTFSVAIPPTEFPNLSVAEALTVGKSLTVAGVSRFEGEVTIVADARFEKAVIIAGNVKIGGSLEIAQAVVVPFTAGEALTAGRPVAIRADGMVVNAAGGRAVIGIAASSAAAGDKIQVAVAGRIGGLSGLATGSRYYVDQVGALTTENTDAQPLGVAVSSTELLVQISAGAPNIVVTPVAPEPTAIPEVIPTVAPTELLTPTPTAEVTLTPIPTEEPSVTPAQ